MIFFAILVQAYLLNDDALRLVFQPVWLSRCFGNPTINYLSSPPTSAVRA